MKQASQFPAIRVVVPVGRSDAANVHECLRALRASSVMAVMEIVIADDTGRDTWSALAESEGVRVVSTGGRHSAAIARNRGARGFRGKVIVFVDDDVRVQPAAIQALIAPILAGAADATVGNYSTDARGLTFVHAFKQIYIATVYRRRSGYLQNEFWTAIGAVRREVFQELAGFCPDYAGAAGEDTEFGCRLTAGGYRVLPVPTAIGVHLKRMGFRELVLNDLKKGTKSAALLMGKRLPLSRFRHSSRRDIAAVILATALLGSAPLGWLLGLEEYLLPAPMAGLGVAYLVSRRDLALAYARVGPGFLAAAVGLLVLLNLIRAVSVVRALSRLVAAHWRGFVHLEGARLPRT